MSITYGSFELSWSISQSSRVYAYRCVHCTPIRIFHPQFWPNRAPHKHIPVGYCDIAIQCDPWFMTLQKCTSKYSCAVWYPIWCSNLLQISTLCEVCWQRPIVHDSDDWQCWNITRYLLVWWYRGVCIIYGGVVLYTESLIVLGSLSVASGLVRL